MSEHNGLPVSGYKPQSEAKVALVNEFKADEERLLHKVDATVHSTYQTNIILPNNFTKKQIIYNPHWTAMARTHFEQGFMALNRSVFQPGRVKLPEDDAETQLPL